MRRLTLALAGALLVVAPPLEAQDDAVVIFSQYFRCGQGGVAEADEIMRETWFPVLDRHVEAGNLTGYGWLAHIQGGAWRRALFTAGSDLDQMMDTRQEIVQELAQDDNALTELGAVCPSHDDYIWNGVSNSPANPDALGTASISSYHMCERGVDMGHIASWGWYAHRSGGVFRRLETMSGADHKTLLNMQAAIYGEADPLAMQELFEICETHVDYMWNNITEPSGP
jgi:hypothetical protein